VPGLRHELVTALIRSLPKQLRVNFVPAPNWAREFLAAVVPGGEPLLDALERYLLSRTGVVVARDAWDWSRVAPHLQPTYRVVDDTGAVVGIVSTSDLIVQETQLHYPTVISLFGAYLELPSSVRRFEEDLRRAVGATVGDVMNKEPLVCDEDDTLEQVATVMHEKEVSRMPVVHAGRLVGLISQGDILRAMLAERSGGA
jgi:predicted transcriptional regulator